MKFNLEGAVSGVVGCGVAVLVFGSVAACNAGEEGGFADDRGRGDVPVATRDYGKPHVVNNANGFGNVSIKCDGKYGYMLFMPTHDLSDVPPVVVPDPRCPGYRDDLRTPSQPSSSGQRPPDNE